MKYQPKKRVITVMSVGSKPLESSNQEDFCQHRASGKTPSECADILKLTLATCYKYSKLSEVQDRIEHLKLERRDLSGLDFGEQFRKWNELYRLAISRDNLKVAKECLEKIDSLGGFGAHGESSVQKAQAKKTLMGGESKSKSGDTFILFNGDDPNDTTQLSETLAKFKSIVNITPTTS